ncbi:hypothetical protein HYT59_01230 [Candidatus Woesebacteria bacterium]|nr:hypothetical protein [Candidatus Woesebacteria bacterium]
MSKLVLIDGNAIMHRAYHALPPMTSKDGKPINAVYGLVSMLLKVITDLKPTHIAFAFDRKEPTFRHKELPEYQAQRPKMDKDLDTQFEIAKNVIGAFGIPLYDKAGYEADDILGTIAHKSGRVKEYKSKSRTPTLPLSRSSTLIDEIVVVTGDRDMLQLVSDRDRVKLYMPVKGLSEAKLFGRQETIERMGVPPKQIVDYKALVGDPSDNYKGVPGIGPKTAIKLLKEYGTLDKIYKDLDNLPSSTKSLLQKSKDSAYVSQKLAQIVQDVDMDINIDEMSKWQLDSPKVLSSFEEIGFKTLTKRVKELGKKLEAEKQMNLL